MQSTLIGIVMILIPAAAYVLAPRAHSPAARRILQIGGGFFAVVTGLSIMAAQGCAGDLMNGFTSCGPGALTQAMNFAAPLILFGVMAYLTAGPILLVAALVIEALHRKRG